MPVRPVAASVTFPCTSNAVGASFPVTMASVGRPRFAKVSGVHAERPVGFAQSPKVEDAAAITLLMGYAVELMFVNPTLMAAKSSAQVSVTKSVSSATVVPLTSHPEGAQLMRLVRLTFEVKIIGNTVWFVGRRDWGSDCRALSMVGRGIVRSGNYSRFEKKARG